MTVIKQQEKYLEIINKYGTKFYATISYLNRIPPNNLTI